MMIKIFRTREKALRFVLPILILTVMFLIALCSSMGAFGIPGDSATSDEIAHIPAGYTYVHDLDYRFNPEHPPLAKALSGVFMILAGIKGPENDQSWNAVDQWEAGRRMIYGVGNSPDAVFFWSRLPMIFLMIGLGLFLYFWAVKLYGWKIGLVVLTLYAFYPDIIAHGRLVTTDVAAALGYVLTIYFFNKAINERTWKQIAIAGLAFGAAQLLKFSALGLFLILFILIIIKAVLEKKENLPFSKACWLYFKTYFWVCSTSMIVVWMVYTLFLWRTPASVEHKLLEIFLTTDPSTLGLRNFLHLFEGNPLTRPIGHYLLGMLFGIGRVFFGQPTFILGHLSLKTIAWYFPVAWLLKTPIPVIVLVFASVGYFIFRFPKEKNDRWTLALLLTPIMVYWAISLIGSLNIGIRHLLPTVPFVLLFIGFFCKKISETRGGSTTQKVAIFVLLGYMIISTVSYYPEYIAYFNEATPRNVRYTRLVDSSLDWGQDLKRLKQYVENHSIKDIKLDYFGNVNVDPTYYIPDAKTWDSEYGPTTGWMAISATYYQASKMRGELCGKWSYHWLDSRKPRALIGGSILVFNIEESDLTTNPPTSPYPITKTVEPYHGRKMSLIMDLVEQMFKKR